MGIPYADIKKYIKSVQTEFKTLNMNMFAQGHPLK